MARIDPKDTTVNTRDIGKTISGKEIYLIETNGPKTDSAELVIGESKAGEFKKIKTISYASISIGYNNSSQSHHYSGKRLEDVAIEGDSVRFKEATVEEEEFEFATNGKPDIISRTEKIFRYDTLTDRLEKLG
jgi:hypothetical protein